MAYDPQRLIRHLINTDATPNCLSCGATNVRVADTRYALVELDAEDHLAVEADWGLASSLKCGARICNACSYVHLYALAVIDRHEGTL